MCWQSVYRVSITWILVSSFGFSVVGFLNGQQPSPPYGHPPQQRPASTSNLQTYYTNQAEFKLPFQTHVQNAVEIQLFVSLNGGRSWTFQDRTNPNAKQFEIKGARPGEYWFALKSIDRDRQSHPAGKLRPGMVVIVDQTKPSLDVSFETDQAGRIVAHWKASDEFLDPNAISIRYKAASNQLDENWLSVPIAPKLHQKTNTAVDQIAWWPGISAPGFIIEAEIRDLAGNRTVVQRQLDHSGATRFSNQSPPLGVSKIPLNENSNPFVTAENNGTPEIDKSARPPAKSGIVWDSQSSHAQQNVIAAASTGQNLHSQDPARTGAAKHSAASEPVRNQSGKVPAHFASASETKSSVLNSNHLMSIAQPVNSKRLALNYTVDAVGPSGVKQVQLWATTDGGTSWQNWGDDEDRASPFVVNAPEEGVYGFRIVVMDNEGLIGKPPVAGDQPDMFIRIDTTAPEVRITSAPFGKGEDAGRLAIYWEANDLQLGLRPITLSYSASPNGPWSAIAEHLPNTGYHAWKTTRKTPEQVYLRIDASDQAGNQNYFITRDPIDVSGLIPRGRVRGVQAIR